MAFYTVHVPKDAANPVRRADRTVFVREGFNPWALVFGGTFLLWHRLWIAALGWFVLTGAIIYGAWLLHPPAGAVLTLFLLLHVFLGVEGNDLRRGALERRRIQLVDVVSGAGRDEAEIVFFHRQPDEPRAASGPASRVVARATTPSVIGMFPGEDGS